jgi:Protein of unknown function (DUF664)
LSFARHCVLKKAGGLSDEQLRRVLTGSGTSILGLVQHLAEVERYWFGYHLAGASWDAGQEYGMAIPADCAAADVLAGYRAAIEDHGPHDERDRAACRARGYPPGAARRHHRPLNPASAAQAVSRWIKDAPSHPPPPGCALS